MPLYYNDALDDPLLYDEVQAFTGGQNSRMRSNLLGEFEFAAAENMDVGAFGSLRTRRGTERVGDMLPAEVVGLIYHETTSSDSLVAVAGGKLYQSSGSTWTEVLGYQSVQNVPVNAAELGGKLYLTDGTSNMQMLENSIVTDLGVGGNLPPHCHYLVAHTSRLFAAGDDSNPDTLYVSDILDGTYWDKGSWSLQVGIAEGGRITGLSPWYNSNLVVFRENSIHVINADPTAKSAADWTISQVDSRIGCVADRSAVQVGADVFFLARDGVRSLKRIFEGNNHATSQPLSTKVEDLIERINWGYAHESCATFWNNRYLLAVPVDGATYPNMVIVFNTLTQSWSGFWTGWAPRIFAVSRFGGVARLCMGQHGGAVSHWLDSIPDTSEDASAFLDDGESYPSSVELRSFVFNERLSPKQASHLEVEFYRSRAQVDVWASPDLQGWQKLNEDSIETLVTGFQLPLTLPVSFPSQAPVRYRKNLLSHGSFHELSLKVSADEGKVGLRSVKATAYLDTLRME